MNIYKYIIVFSFLSLWLNSYISPDVLYLLGFILILSFGILHGANDVVIINKTYNSLKNKSIIYVIGFYLGIVLIFSLFFTFIPTIALLCFILLSAYHFGEQHWQRILNNSSHFQSFIFQCVYGSLIFCLIFYFQQEEVELIIKDIAGYNIDLFFLKYVIISLLAILLFQSIYFYKTNKLFRLQLPVQIFYLLVLVVIFGVADLIWSFSIYFVLWHSIPSLIDQIKFIHKRVNKTTVLDYLKSALWYWLISIIGLFAFFWFFKDQKIFETLFFSFLAAITFPHVFVISKMFKKKEN
jgi:Brp/Blh family beta-carotene 15,15'-monooxygenase